MRKVSVCMWPQHDGSNCEVSGLGMDSSDGGDGNLQGYRRNVGLVG